MKPEPMREYVISPHARWMMARRGLEEGMIQGVLVAPEQQQEVRPGRIVLQSRVAMGAPPRSYLVRVFVDRDRQPREVVTAYRTSKISKYWEEEA